VGGEEYRKEKDMHIGNNPKNKKGVTEDSMIYIDANANRTTTWNFIAEVGGYQHYTGSAQAGDTIIRWGANHGQYQGRYPEGVTVLNKKLHLSKIDQNALFEQHNVPIPKIYRRMVIWETDNRPALICKPAMGQMGTGVIVVRRTPAFHHDKLYQLYIEKDKEFRAMMVGNELAFFMEKHPPENGDHRWNEHRGSEWTSVPEDSSLRRSIKMIGKSALDALGYDFGAIDIIQKNAAQGYALFVLEVNSRPEFGETNAQRFVRAVSHYLERRRQH